MLANQNLSYFVLNLKPLTSSPFLKLVGKKIFPSSSVKYLGVRLDRHLNQKPHISDIATKLQSANGMLSKLRHNPGVVNRTQSTFDQPPNQSNLIEYNRSIVFRLIESIERSSNQSNFPNFFVIDSMSVRLPFDCIRLLFDCIRLLFDCIRFMKILHSPFCFFCCCYFLA